jgi:hypothetical protein
MVLKTRKIQWGTLYSCPTIWGATLNVFNTILYENEFQNPGFLPSLLSIRNENDFTILTVIIMFLHSGRYSIALKIDS